MRVTEGEIEFSSYLLALGNENVEFHPEIGDDTIPHCRIPTYKIHKNQHFLHGYKELCVYILLFQNLMLNNFCFVQIFTVQSIQYGNSQYR